MNTERRNGTWKIVKGNIKVLCGKVTHNQSWVNDGVQECLTGRTQVTYAIINEGRDRQLNEFLKLK